MYDAISTAINDGSLDAQLSFVFSNRERHESETTDRFFDQIEADHIPLIAKSSVRFRKAQGGILSQPGEQLPEWRVAFDEAVAGLLTPYHFDIGILAGYMLIFTAPIVEKFPLLNLHPALPTGPVGTWREVNQSLIRQSATESGLMMNLAIPEVDKGPVVAYCRYRIDDSEFELARSELGNVANLDDKTIEESQLFALIRKAGLRREPTFVVELARAIANHQLNIPDMDARSTSTQKMVPIDLTQQVDQCLLDITLGKNAK